MPRVYREDNRRACRKGERAVRRVPGTPPGVLSPRISRDPFSLRPRDSATAKFTRARLGESTPDLEGRLGQRSGISLVRDS